RSPGRARRNVVISSGNKPDANVFAPASSSKVALIAMRYTIATVCWNLCPSNCAPLHLPDQITGQQGARGRTHARPGGRLPDALTRLRAGEAQRAPRRAPALVLLWQRHLRAAGPRLHARCEQIARIRDAIAGILVIARRADLRESEDHVGCSPVPIGI